LKRIYPTLALPLQRGGNKISDLPPLQGGIKGGNSEMRFLQGIFFLGNLLKGLSDADNFLKVPLRGTFKKLSRFHGSAMLIIETFKILWVSWQRFALYIRHYVEIYY